MLGTQTGRQFEAWGHYVNDRGLIPVRSDHYRSVLNAREMPPGFLSEGLTLQDARDTFNISP